MKKKKKKKKKKKRRRRRRRRWWDGGRGGGQWYWQILEDSTIRIPIGISFCKNQCHIFYLCGMKKKFFGGFREGYFWTTKKIIVAAWGVGKGNKGQGPTCPQNDGHPRRIQGNWQKCHLQMVPHFKISSYLLVSQSLDQMEILGLVV